LISVLPNAGLPLRDKDGKTFFPLTPNDFAKWMVRFVNDYGVNIVGGCCGTTPAHLKALIDAVGIREAKKRSAAVKPQIASLFTAEDLRQETSYLIVAERTKWAGGYARGDPAVCRAGEGPDHARQHRSEGDGSGSEAAWRAVHPQFDEPGGWGGAN
jgi:hypothetical protein